MNETYLVYHYCCLLYTSTGDGTEGKYLFDGLHPNSDGYQLLSDYFSRKINKICRYSMGK